MQLPCRHTRKACTAQHNNAAPMRSGLADPTFSRSSRFSRLVTLGSSSLRSASLAICGGSGWWPGVSHCQTQAGRRWVPAPATRDSWRCGRPSPTQEGECSHLSDCEAHEYAEAHGADKCPALKPGCKPLHPRRDVGSHARCDSAHARGAHRSPLQGRRLLQAVNTVCSQEGSGLGAA